MDPSTSAALYAAGRDRILAAARDFSPTELDRVVPACPDWTVHDLLEQLITSGTTSHPMVCNPYADASVHEADLAGAVGLARPPREAWRATLDWMFDGPSEGVAVHTPDGTYWIESDGPAAEVSVDTYELFRAVFGRRSRAQIRTWAWSSADAAGWWSSELPMLPQTTTDLVD
jgi:hypothetical protein